MKQLFLFSGGADSIVMVEKYLEANSFDANLEFLYIDHAGIQTEKKLMELNSINKYFNYLERMYAIKPLLNIINVSRRLYTRETIYGAHHNPMWLGAIVSVLPALPKKFVLNIGLTRDDHMSRYYSILKELLHNAAKLYEWSNQEIVYELVAPIIKYNKYMIYEYLYPKKLISMFWTCEGVINQRTVACGKCVKCCNHKKMMDKFVGPDEFFKIECERHMSFEFKRMREYIKDIFRLDNTFLYGRHRISPSIDEFNVFSISDADVENDDALII